MTYKQLIITVLVAIYALLATYVFPKNTTTYIMTCIIFIKFPTENPRAFRPWDEWQLEYIFY